MLLKHGRTLVLAVSGGRTAGSIAPCSNIGKRIVGLTRQLGCTHSCQDRLTQQCKTIVACLYSDTRHWLLATEGHGRFFAPKIFDQLQPQAVSKGAPGHLDVNLRRASRTHVRPMVGCGRPWRTAQPSLELCQVILSSRRRRSPYWMLPNRSLDLHADPYSVKTTPPLSRRAGMDVIHRCDT